MANVIKGLTVEIGGDTTKLGKALEDVDKKTRNLSSELGEVNRLLKMDPGNADLLAQKQKILAEAVENTAKKLGTLKDAEKQVQKQFERGEVSEEQVRALKREIEATEQKLNGYKKAVKETADEVEDLGKKSKVSAEDMEKVGAAADVGLKAVAGLATAAVGALAAAAETTREYRTEMGKLTTAFTDNGHSTEAAKDAYQELQGVLGETDQAVEAANHLAKLTDNEKDLATWTGDILPGVFATFGASLPIEGLTEAANETAKVGALTGPLTDAINWAADANETFGVSLKEATEENEEWNKAVQEATSAEDFFNLALQECSTEQERQALITETLTKMYGDASQAYKETNADVIAANQANEAWTASLAQVGEAVEPVLTDVKMMAAELLGKMVPAITAILDNLPAVGVALAGITAALASYKVAALAATAAENGMTLAKYAATAAQTALNVAMNANPIGLVILAITGLVTAFMLLWKNSESFRAFWINLWENIKSVTSTALNAVVTFFQQLPERVSTWLTSTIEKVTTWASNLATKAKEAGLNFLNGVVNFFKNLPYNVGYLLGTALGTIARWAVDSAKKAKEAGTNFVKNFINFVKNLPANLQTWLTNTIARVSTWGTNMVSKAKTAATNTLNGAVNVLKNLPSKAYSAISGAIQKVVSWGSQMVSKGKTAASNLVSSVTSTLKELPGKVLSIGGDLVAGLWNGINDKFSWLKSKVKSFASGVLDGIKNAFGVHSPAESRGGLKTTDYVGEMLDEGLANGLLDNADTPVAAMRRVSGSVLGAASAPVDGLTLSRQLSRPAALNVAPAASESGLGAKLDSILAAIERGQVLMLDGDALVGATASKMDNKLGQRRALAARGAV